MHRQSGTHCFIRFGNGIGNGIGNGNGSGMGNGNGSGTGSIIGIDPGGIGRGNIIGGSGFGGSGIGGSGIGFIATQLATKKLNKTATTSFIVEANQKIFKRFSSLIVYKAFFDVTSLHELN